MERKSKKKDLSIYMVIQGVHKNFELDFPHISLLFAVARNMGMVFTLEKLKNGPKCTLR